MIPRRDDNLSEVKVRLAAAGENATYALVGRLDTTTALESVVRLTEQAELFLREAS